MTRKELSPEAKELVGRVVSERAQGNITEQKASELLGKIKSAVHGDTPPTQAEVDRVLKDTKG